MESKRRSRSQERRREPRAAPSPARRSQSLDPPRRLTSRFTIIQLAEQVRQEMEADLRAWLSPDRSDCSIWRWTSMNQYLASSAYGSYFQGHTSLAGAMELWKTHAPVRHLNFRCGFGLREEDHVFYDTTCEYNAEDIGFSVFSQKGGTDIKVGSTTIHVPKYCSVYHPVVQMVLFAEAIRFNCFYCPRPMMPKGISDLIKKSSSDKCSNAVPTVYIADWAPARGHSTNSHNGDAICEVRSQKVVHQTDRTNWRPVPVLINVSSKTVTSILPPSDETQEAGSMDTAGIVCKPAQLHCQHDGLDNSSCFQEEQKLGLKNPNTYALLTGQSLTPGVGTSSCTRTPAAVIAGTIADFMQWHCRPEGEASVQAQEQEEQQCKVKNLDTYALATTTTQSQTLGDGNRTPALWLDSGAGHHCVGDASVLCNLRDPPAGTAVRVADGFRLPVTKIGDIRTENFQIQDVYLVPGLQLNVISVRQLAKCKIFSTFYENHAELCRQGEQVGGAIVDDDTSIYRLYYLAAVGNAAASTS